MCQKLWKFAGSCQSYCKNYQAYFFGPPCTYANLLEYFSVEVFLCTDVCESRHNIMSWQTVLFYYLVVFFCTCNCKPQREQGRDLEDFCFTFYLWRRIRIFIRGSVVYVQMCLPAGGIILVDKQYHLLVFDIWCIEVFYLNYANDHLLEIDVRKSSNFGCCRNIFWDNSSL